MMFFTDKFATTKVVPFISISATQAHHRQSFVKKIPGKSGNLSVGSPQERARRPKMDLSPADKGHGS